MSDPHPFIIRPSGVRVSRERLASLIGITGDQVTYAPRAEYETVTPRES